MPIGLTHSDPKPAVRWRIGLPTVRSRTCSPVAASTAVTRPCSTSETNQTRPFIALAPNPSPAPSSYTFATALASGSTRVVTAYAVVPPTPQVASQSDVAAGAIGPQATPSSSIVASTDPSAGLMRSRRPVSSPTHRLPKPEPNAVAFESSWTVASMRPSNVTEPLLSGEAAAEGETVPWSGGVRHSATPRTSATTATVAVRAAPATRGRGA